MIHLNGFTFQVASTPKLREAVHRLRYKVYVEEYGFERVEDHPHGLEKDCYDHRSIQVAAQDERGDVIGAGRLILNTGMEGLPTLKFADPLTKSLDSQSPLIVEVSRLALSRSLRGKVGEGGVDKRVFVLMGILQTMAWETHRLGSEKYFIMSEPRLVKMLSTHGIHFKQIGPEANYHGRRAPFAGRVRDINDAVSAFRCRLTVPSHTPVEQSRCRSTGSPVLSVPEQSFPKRFPVSTAA